MYGKDIGLHLSPSSRIADLGCGSCGALMDIMAAGQSQAAALGIAGLLDLQLAGLLRPGGRFLCIDPCVLTGGVSTGSRRAAPPPRRRSCSAP